MRLTLLLRAGRPLTLKLELSKTPLSEVTSLQPNTNTVGIYKFPTLVLRTPINKVPMLPITQLALYVWHCLHMHEVQSGAYENKSVYDYITSLAVRRKVKPEVIMNEMYEAGVAALERREGRVLKDFIAQVALATQNTRTRGERRKSLGYMRDAAAALWYIFPQYRIL